MKKENAVNKKSTKGFTLLELLVVVLIIGILAAIALPQYKMAVTKAEVSALFPLMKMWKDSLQEWKLRYGNYCKDGKGTDSTCDEIPNGSDLGVTWPSDWKNWKDSSACLDNTDCYSPNGKWRCYSHANGNIYCRERKKQFFITFYQPDYYLQYLKNMRNHFGCSSDNEEEDKICQKIGGKFAYKLSDSKYYILN